MMPGIDKAQFFLISTSDQNSKKKFRILEFRVIWDLLLSLRWSVLPLSFSSNRLNYKSECINISLISSLNYCMASFFIEMVFLRCLISESPQTTVTMLMVSPSLLRGLRRVANHANEPSRTLRQNSLISTTLLHPWWGIQVRKHV